MMKFAAYPTGRPLFVDPTHVGAVVDTVEITQTTLAGGKPSAAIVGATIVVQGVPVQVHGEAEDIASVIMNYLGSLDRAIAFGSQN